MITVRLPEHFKEQLEAMAELEADTVTGLFTEGAARILEDGVTGRGFNATFEGKRKSVSCRLPLALIVALETMVDKQEQISFSDLIVEGAARVIRDRHADDDYVDNQIAARMAEFTARRYELAATIEEIQTRLAPGTTQ